MGALIATPVEGSSDGWLPCRRMIMLLANRITGAWLDRCVQLVGWRWARDAQRRGQLVHLCVLVGEQADDEPAWRPPPSPPWALTSAVLPPAPEGRLATGSSSSGLRSGDAVHVRRALCVGFRFRSRPRDTDLWAFVFENSSRLCEVGL